MLRIAVTPHDGSAPFQWREPFEDADAVDGALSAARQENPDADVAAEELVQTGEDEHNWQSYSGPKSTEDIGSGDVASATELLGDHDEED